MAKTTTAIKTGSAFLWGSAASPVTVSAAVTSVAITASGTTATVTKSSHGYSTNDIIVIDGAGQQEYNMVATITVSSSSVFTYTMATAPAVTTATGTINCNKVGSAPTAYSPTSALGAILRAYVLNGTAPGVAASFVVLASSDGTTFIEVSRQTGVVTANTQNVFEFYVDPSRRYLKFYVCQNTTNAVTVHVSVDELTSLSTA